MKIDANVTLRLREIEARATPGPWREGEFEKWHVFSPGGTMHPAGERVLLCMNKHFPYERDALLIAEMRNALPGLLRLIELADAVVEHAMWEDMPSRALSDAVRAYNVARGIAGR